MMNSFQGRPAELWIQMLRDPNPRRREQATHALVRIGPPAVTALVYLYVHGHNSDRKAVLTCLSRLGGDAKEALPVVMKALKDPHPDLRKAARKAFEKIDPDAAIRRAGFWRRLRYWCRRLTRSTSAFENR